MFSDASPVLESRGQLCALRYTVRVKQTARAAVIHNNKVATLKKEQLNLTFTCCTLYYEIVHLKFI